MANYRALCELFESYIQPEASTPQKGDVFLMEKTGALLMNGTSKSSSDAFIFYPWLARLIQADIRNETIIGTALTALWENLRRHPSLASCSFENFATEKFLKVLITIGFAIPFCKTNYMAWQFLSDSPAWLQVELLSVRGLDASLDMFFEDYRRVSRGSKNDATAEPPLKNIGNPAADGTVQERFTEEEEAERLAVFVIKAFSGVILLNWPTLSLKSSMEYRDVSVDFLGKIIVNAFGWSDAPITSTRYNTLMAATHTVDVLIHSYLSVSENGLESIPACFLDTSTVYNGTYGFLLVRLAPKLVNGMRSIMKVLLKALSEASLECVDLAVLEALPEMFKFDSLWDVEKHLYSSGRYSRNKSAVYFLEVWALRAALVCILAYSSSEVKEREGGLLGLKQMAKQLLVMILTAVQNTSAPNFATYTLFCRAVLSIYVLNTIIPSERPDSPLDPENASAVDTTPHNYATAQACVEAIYENVKDLIHRDAAKDDTDSVQSFSVLYTTHVLCQLLSHTPILTSNETKMDLLLDGLPKSIVLVEGCSLFVWKLILSTLAQEGTEEAVWSFVLPFESAGDAFRLLEEHTGVVPPDSADSAGGVSTEMATLLGLAKPTVVKKKFSLLSFLLCRPQATTHGRESVLRDFEAFVAQQHKLPKSSHNRVKPREIPEQPRSRYWNTTLLRYLFSLTNQSVHIALSRNVVGFVLSFLEAFSLHTTAPRRTKVAHQQVYKLLSEELIGAFIWNLSISYLMYHPLLSRSMGLLGPNAPLPAVIGLQQLQTYALQNAEFFWIDQIAHVLSCIWPIMKQKHAVPSATACAVAGVAWMLLGCYWIFYHLSQQEEETEDTAFANLPGKFPIVVSDLSADIQKFSEEDNTQNTFPYSTGVTFSIVLAYVLYALKRWLYRKPLHHQGASTLPSWIEHSESCITSTLGTYQREMAAKLGSEGFGLSTLLYGYVTDAMERLKRNQTALSVPMSQDSANCLLPDPYLGSLTFTSWRDTLLLHTLHRSIVWCDNFNAATHVAAHTISDSPLMLSVQQRSRFVEKGIILLLEVDISNVTDAAISNLHVELHSSLVSASPVDNAPVGPLESLPIKRSVDNMLTYLDGTSQSFTSLSPFSREACTFVIALNSFVPIQFSLSLTFDAPSEFPDLTVEEVPAEIPGDLGGISPSSSKPKVASYAALQNMFELSDAVSVNHQVPLLQPTAYFGVPLSMFVRPYYGLGMWHDVQPSVESVLVDSLSASTTSVPQKRLVTEGLEYQQTVWINSQAAREWNPKCLHMLHESPLIRTWVGEVLLQADLLIVSLSFPEVENKPQDPGIATDIRKDKSHEDSCLCKVLSTSAATAAQFSSFIEYWMVC